MELDTCINGRRSVRSYKSDPVSKEDIESVIEAGTWAPTGMDRQPWKFIIIEDKALIRYVSEETKALVLQTMPSLSDHFRPGKDSICYGAPVLILVCTERDPEWAHVNLLDSVLATQNMFLKAYELGLGTCYMGFIEFLNSKPEILRKMGIPEDHALMVPFVLGHPAKNQKAGERNKPNIIKWVK